MAAELGLGGRSGDVEAIAGVGGEQGHGHQGDGHGHGHGPEHPLGLAHLLAGAPSLATPSPWADAASGTATPSITPATFLAPGVLDFQHDFPIIDVRAAAAILAGALLIARAAIGNLSAVVSALVFHGKLAGL